jgi:hypothetical protein
MFYRKGHAYQLSTTTNSYDNHHDQPRSVHNCNLVINIEATTSRVGSRGEQHSAATYAVHFTLQVVVSVALRCLTL